jgi:hypothetical protein
MKRAVSSLLVVSGSLVATLGFLEHQLTPDLAWPTLLAGLTGGGLSALWGVLGLFGRPHRGWAIFTMAATGFVLLSQVVTHWMPSGEPKPGTHTLALLEAVMLLVTLGTLVVVAHARVPGSTTGDGGSTGSRSPDRRHPPASDTPDVWKEAHPHRTPTVKP